MNTWQMLHELNSLLVIEKKNKRMRSPVAKALKVSLKVVRRALTVQDYEVELASRKQKATVRWFDNLSQEGMIRLADGSSVYVNNDPCHGYRLMKGERLELHSGQEVRVTVFEDVSWRQIESLEVV